MRSILDYGSIIWDPYQTKDIEKLEHVQRHAAMFISNDYQSLEEGYVTGMLQALGLSSLEKASQHKQTCCLTDVLLL